MKRLSLVGILCSILALMRLVSCNDSSLPQDILGEWVADPKILKNLEWMGGGQTKVYSFDWTFGSGSRGWIKAGKTLTLREEGDEAYLNVSIVTPIIYNLSTTSMMMALPLDLKRILSKSRSLNTLSTARIIKRYWLGMPRGKVKPPSKVPAIQ